MTTSAADQIRSNLIRQMLDDRHFAHHFLFGHRHPLKTPAFHYDQIDAYYSKRPRVLWEIFRGGGKSTTSEEAIIIKALLGETDYCFLIRETNEKAVEAIMTIRNEFETNARIHEIFGSQVTAHWNQDDITLKNGSRIRGYGWGQSIRGAKDFQSNKRPDLIDVDDLENEQSVATPEAREKTTKWFNREVIPALKDYSCPVRVKGTRLHPQSWIVKLSNDPEWYSLRVPACLSTDSVLHTPAWEQKFPIAALEVIKARYERDGDLNGFAQEYMCQSVDDSERIFQPRHIVYAQTTSLHLPMYVIVDPARTVDKRKSARTGYLAAGWDRRKLVVKEAFGAFDRPNQITNTIFQLNERHHPVHIGIEKDGLHEFLMQPLRDEQLKRATILPVLALMAPKDRNKTRFISGLHQYFEAGDIVLAHRLPELEQEILNFPQGRVDVLNCLAYMLKVKSGDAMYEDFTDRHVLEGDIALPEGKRYLAINGDAGETALIACLSAASSGKLLVLGDVVTGVDEQGLDAAFAQLRTLLGDHFEVVVPLSVWDRPPPLLNWLRRKNIKFYRGGRPEKAVGSLGRMMATFRRGEPQFQVLADARWTVNALGAGYRRKGNADGTVGPAAEGTYALVGQALDVLAEFLSGVGQEGDTEGRFAHTSGGTRYRTSIPEA